ncbi:hypothetical protein LTR99_007743 [Exophiala xenobiotica]|uniref:Xylanolytic transcriptional activator regulatory domain-containing protein n=1 Tax=Vermiconidia calcicola TaxID=1690605 RepID=A0AAV9Q717_9PEZI|nr:hypothetical protein LTR41_005031 [Exophiala xenobiotica]KAK5535286.1 hypothetical protein LTR25_006294 [Vermiconidia calcicola]KAK5546787.1 hypothetical protein LTR23_003158 [Chaetothyriales sp. CCFEE 6169]KAK5243130.1 hypothetical protein LTS06_011034 [Exophiala xenobiotica]KAK5273686.1 hypothetical protein LTR96_000286 [Exophiala xenobiotica]
MKSISSTLQFQTNHLFLNSSGPQQGLQDQSNVSSKENSDSQGLQNAQYNKIPPLDVILGACDVYFRYCHNQPYSLFHEESFRNKLSLGEIPTHLLYAFLASTIRYTEDPYFSDKVAALTAYATLSWKSIVMPWNGIQSEAELSIVQTILLLAIVDYTDGRTQGAWIKVGLAIRLAQDFRLMVEPDHSLPPVQQEERRRVFWSFYICDKLISCGRDRPATISDAHCRLQLPCDEISFRRGIFQQTLTLDKLHGEEQSSSLGFLNPFALTTIMASTLGRCARYALDEEEDLGPGGKYAPWNPRSKYSALHSILLQLETNLGLHEPLNQKIIRQFTTAEGLVDQHRGAPLVFAHALFHLCQCLLYHPFLLKRRLVDLGYRAPPSFLVHSFTACRNAASALSRLMDDVKSLCCETLTTHYDPFYGYCTMVAAAVHSLFRMSSDPLIMENANTLFDSSMQNLRELAFYWRSCASMKTRLEEFHAKSIRYASLIDPAEQELQIDESDMSDLIECLDYSRMSTKHQRKTQNSSAVTGISQFPSPLFDEFVNLLPFSTNRVPGDMSFDPFFGPITPGFGTNPVNMPVTMPVDHPQSANVPMPMVHTTAVPEQMVFPMESAATSSLSPTASHHSQRQGSTGGSYGSANPISALLIQNGEISQSSNPDGAFTIPRRRMTNSSTSQRPWYETDTT